MRRRSFLPLLGGAAVVWPVAARAQVPVIGFFHGGRPQNAAREVIAFQQGLADAGFLVGQNVAIEYRWANLQFAQLPSLIEELITSQVAVIFAANSLAPVRAAKAATTTIPIVFYYGGDPVTNGFVASLSRPGANLTGMTGLHSELAGKRLGLLHELVPMARKIGLLTGRVNDAVSLQHRNELLAAGDALGVELVVLESISQSFEHTFSTFLERQVGALFIDNEPRFSANLRLIVALAARHKIPAMYPAANYARFGGLIGYSTDSVAIHRQLASQYVARILRGARAADLPVQQPTKFELILNMKTAKALGLVVPVTLLTIADEVIE
jgi:putative ABC transport system substrate-binding protein